MKKKETVQSSAISPEDNVSKGKSTTLRVSQNNCPLFPIEDVLVIVQAIKDNFAGQATSPLMVAAACNFSPSSSNWRYMTGSAIAYGITKGGYNSDKIALTPLGEKIVSPLEEGEDLAALREAIMQPKVLGDFLRKYNRNKLPKKDIAVSVLESLGAPKQRLEDVYNIIRKNAIKANIIRSISGNEYIILEAVDSNPVETKINDARPNSMGTDDSINIPVEVLDRMNISVPAPPQTLTNITKIEKPRIFISHGKNNKTIVGQLKELLSFGQMEPIVSVERETTAIPVPDKVFDDMRSCNAGIIHVELEEMALEKDVKFSKLNENVLIEIGAAIALYGKKVVLLCQKGTYLPSNLQGLYRCEYEGNQLDYSATMKLLKTMQELRNMM